MTGRTHFTASGKRSHHRKGLSRKKKRRLSDELAPKNPRASPVAPKPRVSLPERVEAYRNREHYADRILAKALLGALPEWFGRRDILQKGWAGLTSREGVEAGLDYLVDQGSLRRTCLKRGGRDKIIYTLEPLPTLV